MIANEPVNSTTLSRISQVAEDGSLIVVHMDSGELYAVDPATGEASMIDLGGVPLHGDGLVRTLTRTDTPENQFDTGFGTVMSIYCTTRNRTSCIVRCVSFLLSLPALYCRLRVFSSPNFPRGPQVLRKNTLWVVENTFIGDVQQISEVPAVVH